MDRIFVGQLQHEMYIKLFCFETVRFHNFYTQSFVFVLSAIYRENKNVLR